MMSPAGKQLSINRVLVALDTSRRDNHTLDTAARLAALRNVELLTLFIEDQDLLHLAELPFASEIERASGTERKLDSLQMARAMRTEVQRLSRHLETITSQLRLRYSMRVVRGSYMVEAMAAAMETDILFLNRSVGKYRRHSLARRTTLFRRSTEYAAPAGTIWTWYQSTPGSEAALASGGFGSRGRGGTRRGGQQTTGAAAAKRDSGTGCEYSGAHTAAKDRL